MPKLTVVQRIRLALAAAAGLLGALGFLLGGWGLVYAWLTGHRDPFHGGAMLASTAAPIFLVGTLLLMMALILWPWKRRGAGPAA